MRPRHDARQNRRWAALGALTALVLTLVGCAAPITVPSLTAEDLPRLQAAGNFPEHVYRIEPGDTLFIRYPFHPEMDQEVTVEPDGRITATRVGGISVAGLTTGELEKLLKDRTSDRLRDPEVVVTIRHFSDKPIYVGGEVGKPGPLPYRKGITPLQAVIAAGGFKDTAHPESVILVRAAGSEKSFIARTINLGETVNDGAREPLYLAPHDIIFVPRSAIANANLWVRQHITDLIPFVGRMPIPVP